MTSAPPTKLLELAAGTPAQAVALSRFKSLGFPDRKTEAWHFSYAALRAISRTAYTVAPAAANQSFPTDLAAQIAGAWQITCVNGRVMTAEDAPAGVTLHQSVDLSLAGFDDLPFAALAEGVASEGLSLTIAAGTTLSNPIHIVWVTLPEAAPLVFAPRLSLVVDAGAEATLLESFVGVAGEATLSTPVSKITLGEGAILDHGVLQDEAVTASQIAATSVTVARKASYRSFRLSVGAALARADVRVVLDGPESLASVDGAYAAGDAQHLDATILVDHAAPRGTSHQTWKAVLDGSARGVFQGRIHVRQGANGTNGNQVHKALLLSRQARVDAKPELTVLADDVACAHGAASGALDEDALFYLQARGLDSDTARSLLIEGFLDDVLSGIASDPIREVFQARVAAWLLARNAVLLRQALKEAAL